MIGLIQGKQGKSGSNISLTGSQGKTKQHCLLSISELNTFDTLQFLLGEN